MNVLQFFIAIVPFMDEEIWKSELARYSIVREMEMMDIEDKPFDVKKYDYFLWVEPDTIRYAYNRVKFVATAPTDSVWLHLITREADSEQYVVVDSIIFDNGSIRWPVIEYYSDSNRLVMRLGTWVNPGDTFYLTIYYSGKGGYGIEYAGSSGEIISNVGEVIGNDSWLPLYKTPYEKVDTVIATFKVPRGFKVVSNGIKTLDSTDGMYNYYRWEERYPIAPYLIAFGASPHLVEYDSVWIYDTVTVPLYYWIDTLRHYEFDAHPDTAFDRMINFLTVSSELFGLYPFYREKYGELNCYHFMEYQTVPFCHSSPHELAHQWWGDWVTCGTFDDVWLNEGFAEYFDVMIYLLAYGPSYGPDTIEDFEDRIRILEGNYFYASSASNYPIYGSHFWNAPAVVFYDKAAVVLHMIRITMRQMYGDTLVGDSMFFEALRYYGNQHAYSYATTEDFKNDLEAFTGWDWDTFFLQWIYTPGHPQLDITWRKWESGGTWYMELIMNQIQDSSWMYYTMKYPIRIHLSDSSAIDTTVYLRGVPSDTFYFSFYSEPVDITPDPNNYFLDEIIGITGKVESRAEKPFYITLSGGKLSLNVPYWGKSIVRLYSINGRQVYRREFTGKTLRTSLSLPAGVYIYIVENGGREFRGKVVNIR